MKHNNLKIRRVLFSILMVSFLQAPVANAGCCGGLADAISNVVTGGETGRRRDKERAKKRKAAAKAKKKAEAELKKQKINNIKEQIQSSKSYFINYVEIKAELNSIIEKQTMIRKIAVNELESRSGINSFLSYASRILKKEDQTVNVLISMLNSQPINSTLTEESAQEWVETVEYLEAVARSQSLTVNELVQKALVKADTESVEALITTLFEVNGQYIKISKMLEASMGQTYKEWSLNMQQIAVYDEEHFNSELMNIEVIVNNLNVESPKLSYQLAHELLNVTGSNSCIYVEATEDQEQCFTGFLIQPLDLGNAFVKDLNPAHEVTATGSDL